MEAAQLIHRSLWSREVTTKTSTPTTTTRASSLNAPTSSAPTTTTTTSSILTSTPASSVSANSSSGVTDVQSSASDASPSNTSRSSSSAAPSETDQAKDGLSAVAKAGIGVGAGIGGILLLALLGVFIFRLGKTAGKEKRVEPHEEQYKHELGAESRPHAELNGQGLTEMHSNSVVPELGRQDNYLRDTGPHELYSA
ncbi:hypothetical protein BJ170DRAFT_596349 [Xylariales sp. AK1849]|nr:hypothetical protein BJ170DRAFT_596349 [Xylariales sp. AK1849]